MIAVLVLAPGFFATTGFVWFYLRTFHDVNRWSVVYVLQGTGALTCLAAVIGITATYFGACSLLEHFSKRAFRDEGGAVVRVIEVWRLVILSQLVLVAVAVYLYSYKSLGDAVSNDNIALVEERLNWNLEGSGPNNGLVVETGSKWLERYPLIPVAVRNGNYEMVKLLLLHGAELNPKDWDEYTTVNSGEYTRNSLYFAVMNQDREMIDYLIDLGVGPEQGVYPALLKRDRALLDFFLEEGANSEYALGVAKRMGNSQQKIESLFSDHLPKTSVEADR